MNKFGLLDEDAPASPDSSLTERIAMFSPVRPRTVIDMDAFDAAAAQHGFLSREATAAPSIVHRGRRRRALMIEPMRHLAIRLTARAYDRFVSYADQHKLTYHDALIQLMDDAQKEEG